MVMGFELGSAAYKANPSVPALSPSPEFQFYRCYELHLIQKSLYIVDGVN